MRSCTQSRVELPRIFFKSHSAERALMLIVRSRECARRLQIHNHALTNNDFNNKYYFPILAPVSSLLSSRIYVHTASANNSIPILFFSLSRYPHSISCYLVPHVCQLWTSFAQKKVVVACDRIFTCARGWEKNNWKLFAYKEKFSLVSWKLKSGLEWVKESNNTQRMGCKTSEKKICYTECNVIL